MFSVSYFYLVLHPPLCSPKYFTLLWNDVSGCSPKVPFFNALNIFPSFFQTASFSICSSLCPAGMQGRWHYIQSPFAKLHWQWSFSGELSIVRDCPSASVGVGFLNKSTNGEQWVRGKVAQRYIHGAAAPSKCFANQPSGTSDPSSSLSALPCSCYSQTTSTILLHGMCKNQWFICSSQQLHITHV